MQKSLSILQNAQLALNALDADRAEENDDALHCNDFRSRLLVADGGNGLHVQYDGEVWEDAFEIALKAIGEAANDIVSLKFMGPDEGANGSRTHDFSALLATKASFPNLLALTIRQTCVTDHNFVDIQDGQITPLIARCPNLESLTLPQAPELNFFKLALPKLSYLSTGMHWQTHGFIRHLAASNNMPKLMVFSFSDSMSVFEEQDKAVKQAQIDANNKNLAASKADTDQFMSGLGYTQAQLAEANALAAAALLEAKENSTYDDSVTPFADYCALFLSKRLKDCSVFHLRNARLTVDEFKQLEALRPDLQFSASIEAPHVYVSHWSGKFSKPYQHLIFSHK